MGRGLGNYQKVILLLVNRTATQPPAMTRRQLRAQLLLIHAFPDAKTLTGTQRVTLHRAIKALERRGLIDVVKAREFHSRGGLLCRLLCDDIELTSLGIQTAQRIRTLSQTESTEKTTANHVMSDELTAKLKDPDFADDLRRYTADAGARYTIRAILKDRRKEPTQ
jgi:hypothetical protein